jgi:hypothetical protein
LTCWYDVKTSVGSSVIENTTLSNCSSEEFNVSNDGDFVVGVYANNSYGTEAGDSSSFTVDTDSGGGGDSGDGDSGGSSGGGSGGGTIASSRNSTVKINLKFEGEDEVILKRGETVGMSLVVANTYIRFLNGCGLKGGGGIAGFIKSEGSEGLSRGERVEYGFDVFVPLDSEPGEYDGKLIVECSEGYAEKEFKVITYRNNFEAEILDYERDGGNLKVRYNLVEYSGADHGIGVSYELRDFDNVPRATGVDEIILGAREDSEYVLEFGLPKDSFGEFKLQLAFDDGVVSESISETVFLPSEGGFGGFAISEQNKKRLSWGGIVLAVVLMLVFLGRIYYKVYRKSTVTVKNALNKPVKRKTIHLRLFGHYK